MSWPRFPMRSCRGRLALLLLTLALGALLISLLPSSALKFLGDAFAPDGSLDVLTPAVLAFGQHLARLAALLSTAGGLLLVKGGDGAENLLCRVRGWASALPGRLRAEAAWFRALLHRRPAPSTGIILLSNTLLAAYLRLLWLDAPMQYDEAYTYIAFASRPLRRLVGDYHLPNNHIFHSILVHCSTAALGVHPWSVRLPVFLVGLLLVPLTYLTARLLFDSPTALFAATLTAISHPLIVYAANARGYTLLAAFTLLSLSLAALILRRGFLSAWLGLSILGALGAWTLPVMLYPFGMTLAWLGLNWLAGEAGRPLPRSLPLKLTLCGALAALGALALYTPVLLTDGLGALVGNRWVSPLAWPDFRENLPLRLLNTWREWHAFWPAPLLWLGNLSVGAAWLWGRRVRRFAVPLWGGILAGIFPILLLQRVAPIPKVWLFLLPIWLMWMAAGLRLLVERVLPRPHGGVARLLLAGAVILGAAAIPWERGIRQKTRRGPLGEIPAAAAYVLEHWQAEDGILVPNSLDAPVWFAFVERGLPRASLAGLNPQRTYRRLWVILDSKTHSPEQVQPRSTWPPPLLRLERLQVYLLENPE